MLERIFSIDTLWILLLILYVPACIGLIVIVLLQKGKGTGFGGAFGVGGGGEAVFGPRASRSLPVRLTYIAATLFMTIALIMSLISHRVGKGQAPEMVGVATEDGADEVTGSRFSDLGIGTGRPDEDRVDPSALTAPITAGEGTGPVGEGQPGQVWSEEHGHWHDAPAVDTSATTVEPAPETAADEPVLTEETSAEESPGDAATDVPVIDANVTSPDAEVDAPVVDAPEVDAAEADASATEEAATEETTPEPEGTN